MNAVGETSTLLLLDLSRSLNGKALDNLRLAVKASLANKPIGESVALIALTGNIETSASADPADIKLDQSKESTFSTDANAAVVNKIIQLQPQRGTPLHDAISKSCDDDAQPGLWETRDRDHDGWL